MRTKILKVGEVLIDKDIYPRMHLDFVTMARYMGAMESGAEFPPITVGFLDGKYYLIDGRHRLEATKGRQGNHITTEVIDVKDKQQVYLEAVKRNITHGKQFSTQDVTEIIITLEKWNLNKEQISDVVKIPVGRLDSFVAKRAVHVIGNSGGVEGRASLRKTVSHLAGSTQEEKTVRKQNNLVASEQVHLLNTVISMMKNSWFDLNNEDVKNRLKTLSILITKSIPQLVSNPTVSFTGTSKPKGKRGRPKKNK